MTSADRTIRALRQVVNDAKLNREEAIHNLKIAEAKAESRAIAAAGGDVKALGTNEAAQKRALIEKLADDMLYLAARSDVRDAEEELLAAEADVEAYYEAQRRERTALQRAQLDQEGPVDAYEAQLRRSGAR